MTLKKQFEEALREAEGGEVQETPQPHDVAQRLAAIAVACSIAALLLAIAALLVSR